MYIAAVMLCRLFLAIAAITLSVHAADGQSVAVKTTSIENGLLTVNADLQGKPAELTCRVSSPSCSQLQNGDYNMRPAAADEGIYEDCTNVVLFKSSGAQRRKIGVYCWLNANDNYLSSSSKAWVEAIPTVADGSTLKQSSSKPQISAFFDRIDDGPEFFVECPNTSGNTLSSGAERWTNALRIDGVVQPEPDLRMPPGLTRKVAPEETWRGIIALRQSERSYFPAVKFGAMVRSARVLTITEGKHTLAVQCGEVWSDDFAFYWDAETSP